MPRIQVLAPEVSSRIAAGEVIERPASMLKELLENALDAGASRVLVEAFGAGRKSLRITDDGCGMDPKDCELCLGRHATSKLAKISDLQSLKSYGFRGEALFATAAVSRLSITSCATGSKAGWRVAAEGGRILSSSPAPAIPGTTVEVQDLFFNTPARLKFLRSEAFERARLLAVLEEAALANPSVHFSYKSEGRSRLSLPAQSRGQVQDRASARLAEVLGREIAADLLRVAAERPGFSISLFVSSSEALKPTRELQFWLVNRRPVEARILQQALYRAYAPYRSRDRHPVCVGHLELPPDSFDVNVHPGKREIRFRCDRDVFELVSGLISSALAKSRRAHPLLPEDGVPPAADSREPSPGSPSAVREPSPAYSQAPRSRALAEPLLGLGSRPSASLAAGPESPRWFTPPYRFLGQIERSYLLFEASGGLFILDQHAAAERILFERYLGEIQHGGAKSQKLLLPIALELPASAVTRLLSRGRELAPLGFELAPFGKTALHVLAVPTLFHKEAALKELALRLLDSLEDPGQAAQDAGHHALATIACKAAVKAHDRLGEKEALRLLEDLKDCRDGSCCPHGRRSLLALNREELARRFQRPGAPPR